jgi:hypothetical protein
VCEVDHQPAALFGLVRRLRAPIQVTQWDGQAERTAWSFWDRSIAGIVADSWSIERIVVGSTLVLLGVVSLSARLVRPPRQR